MLEITADQGAIAKLAHDLAAFGPRLPNAQALVLNRVNTIVRQRTIPVMVRETGLVKRIFVKALKQTRASPQNLRATTYAKGGEISLRYFGAHEVSGGVQFTYKGHVETLEGHYFRRSGHAPNRRALRQFNGQVMFSKSGKWVRPKKDGGRGKVEEGDLQVEKSHVFIPLALIGETTKRVFYDVVQNDLPNEAVAELLKLLPGGTR